MQQVTQQVSRPDKSLAPSERPEVRPVIATVKPVIAALALTATLALLALYVHAYDQVARNEYRRQAIFGELRALDVENAQLRCQIDAARSQARLELAAASQHLVRADPAQGTDYLLLPADLARSRPGAKGAPTWVITRKQELAARFASLLTPPPTTQAQAGALLLSMRQP
jgi:hypothetical protein